ncbi:hypothetical protein GWI33_004220 [Rhynchophorus ferrugineus]|uniref:Uncharacterized protein n=1 Tax=Rhynchophorus ferrugineus TaxID=354439 RepID=A0A834IL50_RHYFE|nr:hypothetical protein GWI33_004220 [Rhynchophorus ferrugineus]
MQTRKAEEGGDAEKCTCCPLARIHSRTATAPTNIRLKRKSSRSENYPLWAITSACAGRRSAKIKFPTAPGRIYIHLRSSHRPPALPETRKPFILHIIHPLTHGDNAAEARGAALCPTRAGAAFVSGGGVGGWMEGETRPSVEESPSERQETKEIALATYPVGTQKTAGL